MKLINDSPRLMSDNLSKIDKLSRRALLVFLDLDRSKLATTRLRRKARTHAITNSDVAIMMEIDRAENIAAGGLS